MSVRTIIVVILALIFGASAAILVNLLRPVVSAGETVSVLVAAIGIPRYTNITPEMLKTVDLPKNQVPAGALLRIDDVIDRVVDVPLFKDEWILDAKLSAKGAGRGLAAVIPTGMRAVTIPTPNIASGVAGFILPGNKVDVLLTMHSSGDLSRNDSTRVVLGNVEILAVDQRLEAPTANKVDAKELRSVTLLVSPEDAKKLTLGQSRGTLHLSLRNPGDKEPVNSRVSTAADLQLTQGPEREAPVMVQSAKETLEVEEKRLRLEKDKTEWQWKKEDRAEAKDAKLAKEKAEEERRNAPKVRTLKGVTEGEVVLPKKDAGSGTID